VAAEVEAIDTMVVRALEIRRRRNPGEAHHPRLALCLLRRAELFWTQGRFTEVVSLYVEASAIFEHHLGTRQCKQVAQLAAWTASAWLQAGEAHKAEAALHSAESLSSKVHGESSWHALYLLRDKVAICQARAAPSAKGTQRDEAARKAYARAERYETKAVLLLQSLRQRTVAKGEEAPDPVLQSLSHFAPIYRERTWHPLPDQLSAPPADLNRQSSAAAKPSSPPKRHSSGSLAHMPPSSLDRQSTASAKPRSPAKRHSTTLTKPSPPLDQSRPPSRSFDHAEPSPTRSHQK